MFDTVHFKCKKCGEDVEVQSKAGECLLLDYNSDNIPNNIAEDIDGEYHKCQCGEVFKIDIDTVKSFKANY